MKLFTIFKGMTLQLNVQKNMLNVCHCSTYLHTCKHITLLTYKEKAQITLDVDSAHGNLHTHTLEANITTITADKGAQYKDHIII